MSKILIYSDLHAYAHKKSFKRISDILKVQEWVFESALKNKIKDVVFLGDLFHNRTNIDILSYVLVYNLLKKYLNGDYDLHLWLILGNHDLYHKEKSNIFSPKMLDSFSNITIIDKPCSLKIQNIEADFLPFTENPLNDLKNFTKEKTQKRVLFSHLALDEAKLNSFGTLSDVVVEHDGEMVRVGADKLKYWDKVWLGHYHGHQILSNVEYIGSPYQITRNEINQQKHIVIFDMKDHSTEYIINDFSPIHLNINVDDIHNHNINENFVVVNIPSAMSEIQLNELKTTISNTMSPASLEYRFQKREDLELTVQDAKQIIQDEKTMLKNYFSQTKPKDLDNNIAIEIGEYICQKTNEKIK